MSSVEIGPHVLSERFGDAAAFALAVVVVVMSTVTLPTKGVLASFRRLQPAGSTMWPRNT